MIPYPARGGASLNSLSPVDIFAESSPSLAEGARGWVKNKNLKSQRNEK